VNPFGTLVARDEAAGERDRPEPISSCQGVSKMSKLQISRRKLLKGSAALGVAGVATSLFTARRALAAPLTMGIVYVGPRDDFGWNQAHAVAAEALKGVPDVTVVEEENVPETDAVSKSMESMIQLDGAGLIFATSFGYFDPFMLDVAKKYPDVEFRHAAGLWTEANPKNAGSYFGYLNQGHYVDGVAAGLSTTSNKLGFVAAKPIGTVLLNINSFLLGAKKTNPDASVQVIFTGEWSLPVREAEATNALVDAGCDVITCHVDSPKVVVETAEGRGVKTCGHNADQSPLAANGFITGAEYKWATIYQMFAEMLANGETLPNFVRGGYDKDYVQSSPYGNGASEAAIAAAEAAKEEMKAEAPIVVGPIADNTGKEVVPAGTSYGPYDVELEQTDYLVEGVIGSIT